MKTLRPYWGLIETQDGTYMILRGKSLAMTGASRELAEDFVHYRFAREPGCVTLVTKQGKRKNITRRFRTRRHPLWLIRRRQRKLS